MPESPNVWRLVFDTVERGIGIPLEALVRTEVFHDLLTVSRRARNGALARTERLSRRGLHLANLPAGSDVRMLRDQLARLERRVVSLSKQLEDREGHDLPVGSPDR
jgi:hypothetical protein